MELTHLIVMALVQGITEFLPVSSSAHLILLPRVAGWPDQGLPFDIAVHLGSLAAVIAYFRRDLGTMAAGWFRNTVADEPNAESRLAWAVLVATIPVAVVGFVAHDLVAAALRSPAVIAAATVAFGALLWVADACGRRRRGLETIRWADVVVIGAAQALALVPGTSRSGITITAGLAMGLTRTAAARFSFLLAIPVITFASAWETAVLIQNPAPAPWRDLLLAALLAALSAYGCIFVFLRLLERIGLWPFVLYRFALGAVLWWVFL